MIPALVVVLILGGVTAATIFSTSDRATLRAAPPSWSYASPMPQRRSYTASAAIDGNVYVAAGMVGNTGRPLNLFSRFDRATNTWEPLPQVPDAFSAAAGTSLGDTMYVIGGNAIDSKTADGRQVYAYDVARKRWSRKASLPAMRTNLAAVSLEGKIYAIGGLDPVHPTKTVFVYDPAANRWTTSAPLPEVLHAHAAVVFRGEIWVIGGQGRTGKAMRHVWIFNARRDRWRAGPRLPVPLETAGASVAGDRIYVVLESTSLIYDARTGRWSRGPALETPRHALAVFAIGGTLYAMGGCAVPQLEDSSLVERLSISQVGGR